MTVTEIDTVAGRTVNGGPQLAAVWHCGEHTVRVCIAHDSHRPQSYALAEVRTPALTWTVLCTLPPDEFHFEVFSRVNNVTAAPDENDLRTLATQLIARACRILRVPTDLAPPTSRGRCRDERAGHGAG
jgi:hypothetical protein